MPTIPLSTPYMSGDEWPAVKACLDDNWVSSAGPDIERFEKKFAETVGARHAIATVNGTAALHLALMAADVRAGDEVLMPAITFIATANAVRYTGAVPVFCDVSMDDALIDLAAAENFLTTRCVHKDGRTVNKSTGRTVRAILPVDVVGHPVDIDRVAGLAERHHLTVIEDAAEALGSSIREQPVGGHGNLSCFSFNGNKILTTGAGGMVVTEDANLAARVRYLATQARDEALESVHGDIGYNYRLPNILAAIGLAQLEHLGSFVDKKHMMAMRYREALASIPGITELREPEGSSSNYWLYTVRIDASQAGLSARDMHAALSEAGIETRPLWLPIYKNKPYADCQVVGGERAIDLAKSSLCLPSSIGMIDAEQDRVIAEIYRAVDSRKP